MSLGVKKEGVIERGVKECHDQEEVRDEEAAAKRLWHPSELSLEYLVRKRGGGRLARTKSIL